MDGRIRVWQWRIMDSTLRTNTWATLKLRPLYLGRQSFLHRESTRRRRSHKYVKFLTRHLELGPHQHLIQGETSLG